MTHGPSSLQAALVRECISAIASAAKEDQQELIEAATERARLDIISTKSAAERVEQDLARMSRERLLPDDKTLEKVSRYEAHLSRQLFQNFRRPPTVFTGGTISMRHDPRGEDFDGAGLPPLVPDFALIGIPPARWPGVRAPGSGCGPPGQRGRCSATAPTQTRRWRCGQAAVM